MFPHSTENGKSFYNGSHLNTISDLRKIHSKQSSMIQRKEIEISNLNIRSGKWNPHMNFGTSN